MGLKNTFLCTYIAQKKKAAQWASGPETLQTKKSLPYEKKTKKYQKNTKNSTF